MTDGIELLRLFQRKTPDGDTYFFGTLGDGLVSVVRDQRRRDVWIVSIHNPSQDSCNRSPARALAPPADEGDGDDGDASEESEFDELPADLA